MGSILNSDELWFALDERLEHGEPIDDLIPFDASGLCEEDFLKILAIEATYGKDEKRADVCRRKWVEVVSRGNRV